MDRSFKKDAGRAGVDSDITRNDMGAASPSVESGAEHGACAKPTDDSTRRGGAAPDGKTPCAHEDASASERGERKFTPLGLTYLICAAVSLGFGIFILCLCAMSSASASEALAVILSGATGETDAVGGIIAEAAASLISGALSTIAFGAATVMVGRIAHYLAKKAQETETGVVLLLSEIVKIAAIVLASAVFVIAVLIFVL